MRTDRRRSDAYANVNRIVAAARELFTKDRAPATLSEVAARAGVGNATLYRHFANRQALASAVYEDIFINEIAPAALAVVNADGPQEAFIEVVEGLVDVMSRVRPLLSSLDHLAELTKQLLGRNPELVDAVISRGRERGDVRADLSADDMITFVAMVTTASVALNQPPSERRRYLNLMLDALNPRNTRAS
jgi:AcrR family transcriptional regulator